MDVVGCVCVGVCGREGGVGVGGGGEERGEGFVSRHAYHPRGPPVNSGGQTISLIEFNPGSPQEARRLVAPLGMERAGGGGSGGGAGKSACIDGTMRRTRGGGRGEVDEVGRAGLEQAQQAEEKELGAANARL